MNSFAVSLYTVDGEVAFHIFQLTEYGSREAVRAVVDRVLE
jgi:hypothetical protein